MEKYERLIRWQLRHTHNKKTIKNSLMRWLFNPDEAQIDKVLAKIDPNEVPMIRYDLEETEHVLRDLVEAVDEKPMPPVPNS